MQCRMLRQISTYQSCKNNSFSLSFPFLSYDTSFSSSWWCVALAFGLLGDLHTRKWLQITRDAWVTVAKVYHVSNVFTRKCSYTRTLTWHLNVHHVSWHIFASCNCNDDNNNNYWPLFHFLRLAPLALSVARVCLCLCALWTMWHVSTCVCVLAFLCTRLTRLACWHCDWCQKWEQLWSIHRKGIIQFMRSLNKTHYTNRWIPLTGHVLPIH